MLSARNFKTFGINAVLKSKSNGTIESFTGRIKIHYDDVCTEGRK